MAEQSLAGAIVGNYLVADKVGEGGMGVVYRATHRRLPRRAAVKVLRPEASSNPELIQRFFNEAVSASGLTTPHVVEVLDYGELEDGRSYIVMEWLEGRSLADALRADGAFAVPHALHVLAGVGEALSAAHAHGIVHRDLKPDNVFLVQKGDDSQFVKVLDFGVAKLIDRGQASPGEKGLQNFKTRTGILIGTPAYMSPEQWRGPHLVDHRSDIYSLGLLAYELVTGKLPCTHGTGEDMVVAHVYEAPAPPSSLNPEVAPWLDEVILKALEKAPDDRFPSVSDLIQALTRGRSATMPAVRAAAPPPARPRPAPSPPSGPQITTMRGTSGELQSLGERASSSANRPWLLPLMTMALVGGGIAAAVLVLGQGAAPPPTSLGPASLVEPLEPLPELLPAVVVPEPPADAGLFGD